ncbi:hypothetical protein QR680_006965 [Steinernema hermaphroditum]|uniref:Uncharacterized protein n=1 Tax=Steinernema hermaphroditum TaxID=289476 RepID=A0AA39HX53_9BILA|nr:hypothetical protein QR680_006965 [Steinernema hermaphroditum]
MCLETSTSELPEPSNLRKNDIEDCSHRGGCPEHWTTSPLWTHLKKAHAEVDLGVKAVVQQEEVENPSKRATQTFITDYAEDWHKQRSQKFETLLVKFIADANLSANVTEYQSFKALVRFNASDVKIPSRHELLGPILDREYQRAKDRTQSIFSGKPISITADSYTKGTHSLFAITAHLLTSDFRSVSEIIGIVPCAEIKHTAINLSSLVAENLKSLEISLSDVVGITRDGAANMAAMCDTLGVTSIHCFCHNLHLIVKSSLERCVKADELVKKAIDIVASFRRSPNEIRQQPLVGVVLAL